MKIAIFGGTGGLGRQLIAQAFEAGHTLKVLARTPEKLDFTHDAIQVLKGDGLDFSMVSQTIASQEAVLCAIGGSGLGDSSTRTEVTKNILVAMEEHRVRTLIVCSSLGAGRSKRHLPLIGKLIVGTVLRKAIFDHTVQETAIRERDLDWVIVRPPRLIDAEKTENYRVAEETESFTASQISRADVAHFMLRALEEDKWKRKAISISL
ncbi:MAG: SDR family oxidoreductase [Myxococcota bacterium]|nr:SDR family oxidoreductase [Myxococcota bacterium]